jgi:formate dehydrogenase major subunit
MTDALRPRQRDLKHNALSTPVGMATEPKDYDWVRRNIPCQTACPAGTDIPGYLGAIAAGRYEDAYRINLEDNVFPSILGRVCARPCEDACRHGREGLGDSVAICFSKRTAADFTARPPVVLPPLFGKTGRSVAIIGAGVAGLAAGRDLARMGHTVTVFERHSVPGGMLNQGIPEFRLPRDLIEKEIEQVRLAGVEIRCGVDIGGDMALVDLLREHDAVIMAAGTLRPNVLSIPGHELPGIRHGLDFLLAANFNPETRVGRDVIVIGGGFTAMDCARTAWRLDAENVRVCYRRSVNEMLITPGELEELEHEGIPMEFMVSPVTYVGDASGLAHVRFVRNELGEPDASGRRRPVPIAGSEFDVPATSVLLATGQFPQTSWIDGAVAPKVVDDDEWLLSGRSARTAIDKLFVAGDFATGASTLIEAIGHARDCARQVDTFLMGTQRLREVVVIEDVDDTGRDEEMYEIARQPMHTIPIEERSLTAEVEVGYVEDSGQAEAERCYLCNHKFEINNDLCIYCDNCLRVKPMDDCIVKVNELTYDDAGRITGYVRATSARDFNLLYIDQDECIRCGACADVCPVYCITIQSAKPKRLPAHEVYDGD